jgi:hypothetical protein
MYKALGSIHSTTEKEHIYKYAMPISFLISLEDCHPLKAAIKALKI